MIQSVGNFHNSSVGRKMSTFERFLIQCSGADIDIVSEYKSEWNKFIGIGATILLTACLATLSGAYAMHFVFDSTTVAIVFGIFWGIVIFNLDRYIVLSLRKEKIPTKADVLRQDDPIQKQVLLDEIKRLKRRQILMASPRFIIALIIAVTVSKPIELRLFQNRIDKELENTIINEDQRFDEIENTITREYQNQLVNINKQIQDDISVLYDNSPIYQEALIQIPKLDNQLNNVSSKINENVRVINQNQVRELRYRTDIDPVTGESIRTEYYVYVPNATARGKMQENNSLRQQYMTLQAEYNKFKSNKDNIENSLSVQANDIRSKYQSAIENIEQQIKSRSETYNDRKSAWNNANKNSTDLPARLEALGSIALFSLDPQSKSFLGNSIWWASIVITMLFIALETAPVVVKLLTKRGPYDDRLDTIEYDVYIEENKKIDSLNREVNEYLKLAHEAAKLSGVARLKAEKEKLDIELSNNAELLSKISEYQRKIAEMHVEAWYLDEKVKAQKLLDASGTNSANDINSRIVGRLWLHNNGKDSFQYIFLNGQESNNNVIIIKNHGSDIGTWRRVPNMEQLSVSIESKSKLYDIIELTDNELVLMDTSNSKTIKMRRT